MDWLTRSLFNVTFKDNFCPSPWFHMRIINNGDYEYCRWAKESSNVKENISNVHPVTWFQEHLSPLRKDLLDGKSIDGCQLCSNMERHGKVSGRQKQLLKVGVTLKDFEKTMLTSPWVDEWKLCQERHGDTDLHVQDWQIDLGNFCNSACLFCRPESSSRLASEYQRLGLISKTPLQAWADDPVLLHRFIDTLKQSPHVRYLHFIGGETIITPSFRVILKTLIEQGFNEKITLGFTTNLTVMDQEIVDLLSQFYQINLGVSIECLDPVNDYIRYGGNFERTKELLNRWISLAQERQWTVQIRTTPTVLSINRLDTVYEYAWRHGAAIESCNFIDRPEFMRPSVLPKKYREEACDRLQRWIDRTQTNIDSTQIINIRHPGFSQQQILQDAQSYIRYLNDEPDQSHRLPDLVKYLKIMESSRGNRVTDYLPEYEELFRSAGY